MKNEHHCSPYYRPPEVILVTADAFAPVIDVWSAACTVFELYTGKFLFPGTTS
jgi:serine/threonine-protein kinase PRP4